MRKFELLSDYALQREENCQNLVTCRERRSKPRRETDQQKGLEVVSEIDEPQEAVKEWVVSTLTLLFTMEPVKETHEYKIKTLPSRTVDVHLPLICE